MRGLLELIEMRAELHELGADRRIDAAPCRVRWCRRRPRCPVGAARVIWLCEQRGRVRLDLRVCGLPVRLRGDQLVEVVDQLRDLSARFTLQLRGGGELRDLAERIARRGEMRFRRIGRCGLHRRSQSATAALRCCGCCAGRRILRETSSRQRDDRGGRQQSCPSCGRSLSSVILQGSSRRLSLMIEQARCHDRSRRNPPESRANAAISAKCAALAQVGEAAIT